MITDQQLRTLESVWSHTHQKIRLLRASRATLEVYEKAGNKFAQRSIEQARADASLHERNLIALADELSDEARKIVEFGKQATDARREMAVVRDD